MMRVSQVDTINKLYSNYNDTITNLKKYIKQRSYDSAIIEKAFKSDSAKINEWIAQQPKGSYEEIKKRIDASNARIGLTVFVFLMAVLGLVTEK